MKGLSTNGSSPPPLTDAELLDRWLQRACGRGPRHRATYRGDAERFLAFAKKPLRQASFAELRAFMDYLAQRGVRPGAREGTLRRLGGLLWSLRWQRTELPCPDDGCGSLNRASVPSREVKIYVCDECSAAWTGSDGFSMDTCTSVAAIMEQYSINDDDFEVLQ